MVKTVHGSHQVICCSVTIAMCAKACNALRASAPGDSNCKCLYHMLSQQEWCCIAAALHIRNSPIACFRSRLWLDPVSIIAPASAQIARGVRL